MSRGVTADDRRRDVIALALVAVGALIFIIAWVQLRGLHTGPIDVQVGQRALPIFVRYVILAAAGLALVLAGVGTGVWAHARRARRLDASGQ